MSSCYAYLVLLFSLLMLNSCDRASGTAEEPPTLMPRESETSQVLTDSDAAPEIPAEHPMLPRLQHAIEQSELPLELAAPLFALMTSGGDSFVDEIEAITAEDPYLWALVDKEYALSSDYEPSDLVPLDASTYVVSRDGHRMRLAAAQSLERMAEAAREEGITLMASSAYRSYEYQRQVYQRHVDTYGQDAADRVSAQPGHSQHQLGFALDFGSIDDSFAETAASRWLEANASRFGWSLSYPKGYEELTGYSWESWHYRYVGERLALFIDEHFNGIQQYALRFLRFWVYDIP